MTENEKRILNVFITAIPLLSEEKKNYLLGYGEGIIAARREEEKNQRSEVPVA